MKLMYDELLAGGRSLLMSNSERGWGWVVGELVGDRVMQCALVFV